MWISRKQWQELWAHITRTNHELGEVQRQTKDLPAMRNDIKWLKWLIGLVVAGVLTLILKTLVL